MKVPNVDQGDSSPNDHLDATLPEANPNSHIADFDNDPEYVFADRPALLSVKDLCWYLSIGRTKALELITAGEFDVCRIGRRLLVTHRSVDQFVDRQTNGARR